jgi:hypothetical protein
VLVLAGCGGSVLARHVARTTTVAVPASAPVGAGASGSGATFPVIATRNTTRIPSADPIVEAAEVALIAFPSAYPGTHPSAVVLAPSSDWQASLAAAVLMAAPIHAPLLLATAAGSLPQTSAAALRELAPSGAGAIDGAQVIRVGPVPRVAGYRSATISGTDPYTLSAGIDRFQSAAAGGRPSTSVVIASGTNPAYAMPAAGWAADSGDPLLFVTPSGVPAPTRQALLAHGHPNIYVLGPPSVIPDSVLAALHHYGRVKRIGASATSAAASSVAFAEYRDPPCVYMQPCAHTPGSFGWAIRNPGHGYVFLSYKQPLAAAAAAALSGSGDFGPQLLVENPTRLSGPVLNYLVNYATPGYTSGGQTLAVYNHGWLIGSPAQISLSAQAEIDYLLQAVPQR